MPGLKDWFWQTHASRQDRRTQEEREWRSEEAAKERQLKLLMSGNYNDIVEAYYNNQISESQARRAEAGVRWWNEQILAGRAVREEGGPRMLSLEEQAEARGPALELEAERSQDLRMKAIERAEEYARRTGDPKREIFTPEQRAKFIAVGDTSEWSKSKEALIKDSMFNALRKKRDAGEYKTEEEFYADYDELNRLVNPAQAAQADAERARRALFESQMFGVGQEKKNAQARLDAAPVLTGITSRAKNLQQAYQMLEANRDNMTPEAFTHATEELRGFYSTAAPNPFMPDLGGAPGEQQIEDPFSAANLIGGRVAPEQAMADPGFLERPEPYRSYVETSVMQNLPPEQRRKAVFQREQQLGPAVAIPEVEIKKTHPTFLSHAGAVKRGAQATSKALRESDVALGSWVGQKNKELGEFIAKYLGF